MSETLNPNPFHPHLGGPWHETNFDVVVGGITDLLARYRRGEVTEKHLLRGKDNGRDKRDTLSYWLYYQHHPGSERWKILGQRYWSIAAYESFRDCFFATPANRQLNKRDSGPATRTIPKRKASGDRGLVSEHVVPKRRMKELLLAVGHDVTDLLRLNHCAVVTIAEDRRLARDSHDTPFDPWSRYAGTGIKFIENPDWTAEERAALNVHRLLAGKPTATYP